MMINYQKAEQAKKLFDESGADYAFAYVDANDKIIGKVHGTIKNTTVCTMAIMKSIGELIRDNHGDKAAVTVLHTIMMKALTMIYRRKIEENVQED